MKDTRHIPQIQTAGDMKQQEFRISEGNISHILGILRDQLYTDKVGAVCREYMCNAYDSHVSHGNVTTPIEVVLPTPFNPNFRVRDHGTGMDEQTVMELFTSYGESTKRDSNDFTGMLGIGSKSGFCISDSFSVSSWFGGEKKVYNCYIDESLCGRIALMHSEACGAGETGIEISVPVKAQLVNQFAAKVSEFGRWFKTAPLVNGKPLVQPNIVAVKESEHCVWVKSGMTGVTALMGNIGYPVRIDLLNLGAQTDLASFAAVQPLILKFNIGDLDIAASREGLQYTAKTIRVLIDKLKITLQDAVSECLRRLGAAKSKYHMLCLLHEVFHELQMNRLRHLPQALQNITWKGETLQYNQNGYTPSSVKVEHNPGMVYFRNRWPIDPSERIQATVTSLTHTPLATTANPAPATVLKTFVFQNVRALLIDDLSAAHKIYHSRRKTVYMQLPNASYGSQVLLVYCKDKAEQARIREEFAGLPTFLLSEYEATKAPSKPGQRGQRSSNYQRTDVLYKYIGSGGARSTACLQKIDTKPTTPVYYLPMYKTRVAPEDNTHGPILWSSCVGDDAGYGAQGIKNTLCAVDEQKYKNIELYLVRVAGDYEIDPSWIRLDMELLKALKVYVASEEYKRYAEWSNPGIGVSSQSMNWRTTKSSLERVFHQRDLEFGRGDLFDVCETVESIVQQIAIKQSEVMNKVRRWLPLPDADKHAPQRVHQPGHRPWPNSSITMGVSPSGAATVQKPLAMWPSVQDVDRKLPGLMWASSIQRYNSYGAPSSYNPGPVTAALQKVLDDFDPLAPELKDSARCFQLESLEAEWPEYAEPVKDLRRRIADRKARAAERLKQHRRQLMLTLLATKEEQAEQQQPQVGSPESPSQEN